MASYRKRGAFWFFRYVDEDGKQCERKGWRDLTTTKGMAFQAEDKVRKIRAGLLEADPPAVPPPPTLHQHLATLIAQMRGKDCDVRHIMQTERYASRIIELGGAEQVGDLNADRVLAALETLRTKGLSALHTKGLSARRTKGLSARTLNAHLTAIKTLAHFLVDREFCAKNPLAALRRFKFNEKADRRLVRRVLTEDEVAILLRSTHAAPVWRSMSGPDRAVLYKLATLTGYRRSELGELRAADFVLDGPAPVVRLGAGHTKNGDDAGQQIPVALAAELRPWLAGKAADRPVFDPLPEKTGLMLKADLARAGIDPGDAMNTVDMHSLRHGYVTLLIRSGANLSTVQKLARHSTPDLTSNTYAHLSVHDAAAAVERLPAFESAPPDTAAQDLAATGTDGPNGHISKDFSLFHPYEGVGDCRIVSDAGGSNETTPGERGVNDRPTGLFSAQHDAVQRFPAWNWHPDWVLDVRSSGSRGLSI